MTLSIIVPVSMTLSVRRLSRMTLRIILLVTKTLSVRDT
jgi:hypothetical protein